MVANTLEKAGAGSHDDVRRFFAAELGRIVQERRKRVDELLARPVLSMPRVTSEYTSSGFALDLMLTAARGGGRVVNDTNPDPEITLVDPPWHQAG
jgi:hypothetical protein